MDSQMPDLLFNYLTRRSQLVKNGTQKSNFRALRSPVLYNLYTKEYEVYLNINCTHKKDNMGIGNKTSNNKNRLRLDLFGERCKSCRHSTFYVDEMSIIIKTTKKDTARMAIKIDFIITELGKILQLYGLMPNADKTEMLHTTTRQQLAADGNERLVLQKQTREVKELNQAVGVKSWVCALIAT